MFCLRELERKDLPKINRWRNDPELIALLGAPFRYINLDVDIKWYESYMGNRGNAVRCAIVEEENDEILGLASLVSINYMNQSAEFHIMIGDRKNQGRGIGTFAVQSMLSHAFNNMNLQRVELSVLDSNECAKHLYEKCGFIYEGRKRKARYKNGHFVDVLMYAILRTDFSGGVVPNLSPWHVSAVYDKAEMGAIIQSCDDAFAVAVSQRSIYSGLLSKIFAKGKFFVVYEKDVLGYCAFYANDLESEVGYITLIAIKKKYQGNHIGQKLLKFCLDVMRTYGMKACCLEVQKYNSSAMKFYKSNGFTFSGESQESYYMKCML